jgi:hypothetical protein
MPARLSVLLSVLMDAGVPAGFGMAETNKLSVEKALEKLRSNDQRETRNDARDEKIEALNSEIRRMRAQRSRLERKPVKRD